SWCNESHRRRRQDPRRAGRESDLRAIATTSCCIPSVLTRLFVCRAGVELCEFHSPQHDSFTIGLARLAARELISELHLHSQVELTPQHVIEARLCNPGP